MYGEPGGDSTPAIGLSGTAPSLLVAPGYLARRMYQAYLSLWSQQVSSTLTGPQFAVLTQVGHRPGVDQGSLASMVSLDTSTMTDIAHRLEEKGLLRRPSDVADGRRKLLHLTAEGEQVLAETTTRARELDQKLLSSSLDQSPGPMLAQLTSLAESWERLARNHKR